MPFDGFDADAMEAYHLLQQHTQRQAEALAASFPFVGPDRPKRNQMRRRKRSFNTLRETASSVMVPVASELSENEEWLRFCIDLPGVSAKDVQVALQHGVLKVQATRRSYNIDGSTLLRTQKYSRRYAVDTTVLDVSKITVHLVNGVLTIRAPKKSVPLNMTLPVIEDDEQSVEVLVEHEHQQPSTTAV